ncbi:unnamed protein product [Chilo suppressalis]|uniref:Ig-like domain-containing protein n=1 Tax=Chilo suppressalis TaxID=168631 RepID=A0ABN8BA83_CHISP|nr:unnamed protein product [Chilo suppressalis]
MSEQHVDESLRECVFLLHGYLILPLIIPRSLQKFPLLRHLLPTHGDLAVALPQLGARCSNEYKLALPAHARDKTRTESYNSPSPLNDSICLILLPSARILGGPDLHVDIGSTINLTCLIQFSPEPPAYIFWYHEDEVISYDSSRGGVSVVTEKGAATTSYLLVQDAAPADSGRYSCSPSNAEVASDSATSSYVLVQDPAPVDSGRYSCSPSNAEVALVREHVLNGQSYYPYTCPTSYPHTEKNATTSYLLVQDAAPVKSEKLHHHFVSDRRLHRAC